MLEEHGLYELLRAGGVYPDARDPADLGEERVDDRGATPRRAPGTALFTMERTTYDDRGRAIEFAQHVYRASRYSLVSAVTTDEAAAERLCERFDSSY